MIRVDQSWILFLMLTVLAGCGGSTSESSGQSLSSTPRDALMPVEPARLLSEEDVALLSPGPLWGKTGGPRQERMANFHLGTLGIDYKSDVLDEVSRPCGSEGSIKVLSRTLEDVGSPHTGALYDVVKEKLKNCNTFLELGSEDFGLLAMGFPDSGKGAGNFFYETDFLALIQFGESADIPYRKFNSNQENYERALLQKTFLHLKRSGGDYGEDGGSVAEYSLVRDRWNDEQGRVVYESVTQLGKSLEQPFILEVDSKDGESLNVARLERYHGRVGIERFEDFPDCPGGALQVQTLDNLDVVTLEAPEGVFGSLLEINTGALEMVDDFGNRAVIDYDGDSQTWTITLNDKTPKLFTYTALDALYADRCQ